jgi:hypothetical protein
MRMNIFGFQMAVKNFLKRNTTNFLNYALILRRSVQIKFYYNTKLLSLTKNVKNIIVVFTNQMF